MFFVFPGYYWIWHRRHSFDCKVANVARLLAHGETLSDALQATPGVVPRDALLVVTIGQATGKLALCLRNSARGRPTSQWIQVAARLLYPLILLFVLFSIATFWMIYILPKMQRIFQDFNEELPEITQQIAEVWETVNDNLWIVALTFLGLVGLIVLLVFSSFTRWYFPIFGRLYRMHVQGRVLNMLGLLLEAGKTVPDALGILSKSRHCGSVAAWKLRGACERVEQGQTLADSLRRKGLLPSSMAPLVVAAERMRNLPWALAQLGENQVQRSHRLLQRLSMGLCPLLIVGIGLVVGFVILGMFMPLVSLVTRMAE
jgi:type II secretory pathway component PulF